MFIWGGHPPSLVVCTCFHILCQTLNPTYMVPPPVLINSVYHRPSVICATTIINNCSCLHNAYPGHNFIKYCAL